MKFLKTMPILLLAAFIATSCGKDNSSGSSATDNGTVSGFGDGTSGFPTQTGTVFNTIEDLRTHFDQSSIALTAGTLVIRGSQPVYDLEEVESSSDSSISLKEIIYWAGENSTNHQYGSSRTISKSDQAYQDMLMLNNSECDEVQMQQLSIGISDASSGQQSSILATQATCIEVRESTFLGLPITTRVSRGYAVYSTALPLVANPIEMNINGSSVRRLHRVGNTIIGQ